MRAQGEKILIVDNDEYILKPTQEILEELGYRVACSTNGIAAIAKYKSWKPDVVLLDRTMPQMDGITCAEKIIEHDSDAKIVIISGHDEKDLNGRAHRAKDLVKGYIVKPFEIKSLKKILARVLEGD